jgi:hypothetical protein
MALKRYTQTSTAWYVKYPGDVYALGPIRFKKPVGKMAVREYLREWEKVEKLPVGIEMWPA